VLGVVLFVAFWMVVALGLFAVAVRGGISGTRATHPTRGGGRVASLIFTIIYVGFGIVLPIVFLVGNHANASSKVGGMRLTAAEKNGRELFGQHCGICHTLAATNSVGKVGPNLDVLQPTELLVLNTINNGCLANPPSPSSPEACLGQGNMPANVVQGRNARDVAQFVAKVAGKE
jgi:mono/diheme cytochrome c family protein